MRRFATGLLLLVSALALVLASTSLWVRQNVVDTQAFVSNVETVVDLPAVEARVTEQVTATVMANPEVQTAIDDVVVALPDRLQQYRSTVEGGVSSLVSAGVSRLLASDPFRPLTESALTSAHDQLVAGEPVQFTLGQAKERIPASVQDGLAGQVLDLVPDDVGVTLLTPAQSPEVYNAVDLLRSVWWWLGLVSLGTLAGALAVSRHRRGTVRAWAVTTAVFVLLVLLALRIGRGMVVQAARPDNRDAVGAVYDVFAGDLRTWTLWLLVAAVLLGVLTVVWGRLGLVAGVRRGAASARDELQRRRERARTARVATAEGAADAGTPAAVPTAGEPWTRRTAAWARAFADGLDLPGRTARWGAAVRDHLGPARWAGIVLGAVVLLLWPSPTLSVLIWVAALVALWIGALEWLSSRAPAAAPAAPGPGVPAADGVPAGVPAPRPGPETGGVLVGAAATTASGTAAGTAAAGAPAAAGSPPAPAPVPDAERLVPALPAEAISTLEDRLDLLLRLGAARDAGVLSEEEFLRVKNRLLAS
ncbi:hypothetical protein ACI8AA_03100 [Geodermatophilus sp. SYSU D01180]